MQTSLYILLAFLFLLLNGFFVLAEFAMVKVRPTRIEALADAGDVRAKLVQRIQARLDEYLSVCQVGITFASIGLGFLAEPAVVVLLEPLAVKAGIPALASDLGLDPDKVIHWTAFGLAYALVTYLHVLVGELLPKSVAIRAAEKSALFTAAPLAFFRLLFFPPLWILNKSAACLLALCRLPAHGHGDEHSEDEVRIILGRTQEEGEISFRRLLLIENVLDLGHLKVKDAMRARAEIKVLHADAPMAESDALIAATRFSRYPLMFPGMARPTGLVHVKDLFLAMRDGRPVTSLEHFARPCLLVREDQPLEAVLATMQDKPCHMAIVVDADEHWLGMLTMEDAQEEVLGAIQEEFPAEPPTLLMHVLAPERIVLDQPGRTLTEVLKSVFAKVAAQLPVTPERALDGVLEREKVMNTYLGYGVALPHARLEGLGAPTLVLVRLKDGIPTRKATEQAKLLFVLLTPAGMPRIHQRLQARIAQLLLSEYILDRLMEAETPEALYEVLRTGEQAALDV